jgi:hypothetical protein
VAKREDVQREKLRARAAEVTAEHYSSLHLRTILKVAELELEDVFLIESIVNRLRRRN